jgi:hypothetical protein
VPRADPAGPAAVRQGLRDGHVFGVLRRHDAAAMSAGRRQVQRIRRGVETWELTRVVAEGDHTHEYESIGRVVRGDDGLFYAELPKWQDIGFAWIRVGKGRLIPAPLFKWLDENDGKPLPPAYS